MRSRSVSHASASISNCKYLRNAKLSHPRASVRSRMHSCAINERNPTTSDHRNDPPATRRGRVCCTILSERDTVEKRVSVRSFYRDLEYDSVDSRGKRRGSDHEVSQACRTHERSLSRRVGSILRDDREDTMVQMLMLLLQLQEVVVTTVVVLVADQSVGHGGASRIMWWWDPFAAQAQASRTMQGRRRRPWYTRVRRRRREGACSSEIIELMMYRGQKKRRRRSMAIKRTAVDLRQSS